VGYQWTSVHQRHDTGQEGVRRGIPIPCQLGVRRGFEKLVDVRVTQLPVPAHVSEVVAAELADAGNDNDRVPSATELASLMTRSPRPVLPLAFLTDVMMWRCVDRPESQQIFSSASKIVSWASFVLTIRFHD